MALQITRTTQEDWIPLVEDGVKTEGIYAKVLRFDEAQQRPPTFLLRFDPGASYPNHNHPGAGVLRIDVSAQTFGYPPSQYWVSFQINDSDPAGYSAMDMNGRPFRIWRIT